jgi:hypothetical protein
MCDAFTDFVHLSGDVSSADVGVLLQEDASLLDFPCFLLAEQLDLLRPRVRTVYWVDGNGVVLDDNLALASLRELGLLNLEFSLGLWDPCCLVRHDVEYV